MIEAKESKYIDSVVSILNENEALIDFTHHSKEDQIAIHKDLKEKIFSFVEGIEDEELDAKEFVRYCVREALELDESDIVIMKKDSIFIKLFDHSKKRALSATDVGTVASRFNGIDEEELVSFYQEYFVGENIKDFFIQSATLFMKRYFLEKQIDNSHYEKYVFSYLQGIVMEQLEEIYDHNPEFFRGFAGFIFRKHFKDVFSHISDLILSELVIGNKYMTEFLKYYSLDIVIINGKKYKVPPLQTPDGLKWNVVSLHSVVKVYINTLQNIHAIQKEVETLLVDIDKLYIGELTPVDYNELYIKEKKKITDMIDIHVKKLNRMYDSYELERDDEKRYKLKAEVDRLKRAIEILREKKTQLGAKAIKRETLKAFIDLEKVYEGFQRELKREQKILSQNKETYISIKAALTKVLVSKKQVL